MKKIFLLIFIFCVCACNDGYFDEPGFVFEEKTEFCVSNGKLVLYRLNEKGESALIITLTGDQIKRSTEKVDPVMISTTGDYTATYRVFNGRPTNDYFCGTIPPVEPIAIENWQGVSGIIETVNEPVDPSGETSLQWRHTVNLKNVTFENDDKTEFYQTYFFGTIISDQQ